MYIFIYIYICVHIHVNVAFLPKPLLALLPRAPQCLCSFCSGYSRPFSGNLLANSLSFASTCSLSVTARALIWRPLFGLVAWLRPIATLLLEGPRTIGKGFMSLSSSFGIPSRVSLTVSRTLWSLYSTTSCWSLLVALLWPPPRPMPSPWQAVLIPAPWPIALGLAFLSGFSPTTCTICGGTATPAPTLSALCAGSVKRRTLIW